MIQYETYERLSAIEQSLRPDADGGQRGPGLPINAHFLVRCVLDLSDEVLALRFRVSELEGREP
jgi:hypothetical protein